MLAYRTSVFALAPLVAAIAIGCGSSETEEPETTDVAIDDQIPFVADSVLLTEVQQRLDIDPRLDGDDISVTASVVDQQVMLHGEVPTRLESAIAQEIARSVLGVRAVLTDSLYVVAEDRT